MKDQKQSFDVGGMIALILALVFGGLYCLGQLASFLSLLGGNTSPEPYYDATAEQEELDRRMRDWMEMEEREHKAFEAQDEYENYFDWLANGRPGM